MRYEPADFEWTVNKPMLPNKPRGLPRMNVKLRNCDGYLVVFRAGEISVSVPWSKSSEAPINSTIESLLFDGAGPELTRRPRAAARSDDSVLETTLLGGHPRAAIRSPNIGDLQCLSKRRCCAKSRQSSSNSIFWRAGACCL
jgi:hypothetical protein